jgi:hypothetical protein
LFSSNIKVSGCCSGLFPGTNASVNDGGECIRSTKAKCDDSCLVKKLNGSRLSCIMNGFVAKEGLADFLQAGTSCASWTPGQWRSRQYEPNCPGIVREEAASYEKPRFLDQRRQALWARCYSPKTKTAYAFGVKRYIFFRDVRHPAEMGEAEINTFLTHWPLTKESVRRPRIRLWLRCCVRKIAVWVKWSAPVNRYDCPWSLIGNIRMQSWNGVGSGYF